MSERSRIYLVDSLSTSAKKPWASTDWSKCIICQTVKEEQLQCPAKGSVNPASGKGYSTFASRIKRFDELYALPVPIDIQRLDEGKGIELTLVENEANWHKTCHMKFNASKLHRAEKAVECPDERKSKRFTRQNNPECKEKAEGVCFFCNKKSQFNYDSLTEVSTPILDARVRARECATDLNDDSLLYKLSCGSMTDQGAKYHLRCLNALYNKARSVHRKASADPEKGKNGVFQGIALAELLTFIEEERLQEGTAPIFKLSNLVKLFQIRIEELGGTLSSRPNSTYLRDNILKKFPDMSAHKDGRDILLVFDKDIGPALRKKVKEVYSAEQSRM